MFQFLEIKVVPSSGRSGFKMDKNGTLKCFLKSAPKKGEANVELFKILSKALSLPSANLNLLSGQTSRKKRVKINTNLSDAEILELLLSRGF